MGFTDFSSDSGLAIANRFFSTRSYVEGYAPTQADVVTFKAFKNAPDAAKYPHAARWYKHIASYESDFATLKGDPSRSFTSFGPESTDIPVIAKKPAADDDDSDMDLFGSDDEEEDPELVAQREKNLEEYRKKKATKEEKIAKSFVTLEIKPMSSRTPMTQLRDEIKRYLTKDGPAERNGLPLDQDTRPARPGIVYSADKFKDIGYGIKKLQVIFTVQDNLISVSDLQDDIENYFGDEGLYMEKEIVDEDGEVVEEEEGWVQSTDIVEMQKL
ncbi:hypothetical protein EMPG_17167 [Blastomyces silverae]|uniref:Elongation factor 1-beta n=1 Tax=Blastomyces silverae TaxID=2060906 RepID=A0A0H1B8H7_9EURO|nr:hypothetical protein EMPG_17167 [Blastomyces silverae]